MFGFSNHTSKSEVKMRDDWIYLGSYKNHTQYYRKSSVIIDEEKNTINVLVKNVTKTKDIVYLQNAYSYKEPNYIKCKQQNKWYVFNYEKWQFTITSITDYSKSGNVLLETVYQPKWLHNIFPVKWDDIMPGSIVDLSLDKLLQDYNILNDYQVDIRNNNYELPGKSSNVMAFVNSLIESVTKKANYNFFKFLYD
jgi:hypothetical protein